MTPNFICHLTTFSARRLSAGQQGTFGVNDFDIAELVAMRTAPSVAWVCQVEAVNHDDAQTQALRAWQAGEGELTQGGHMAGIVQPQGIPNNSASRDTASSGNAKDKCATPVPAGHRSHSLHTRKHPTMELTLHPSRKLLPGVDTESAPFKALLNIIAEGGLAATGRHIVTHSFRVVEGADLWEAAKLLGLPAVDTVEIAPEHIESTMLAGLVAREHYTKGQVAFLAYPLLQPLMERIASERLKRLKKGSNSSQVLEKGGSALSADTPLPVSALFGMGADRLLKATTIPQVAEALGISERLFRMAGQLHKEFAADPQLAEQFIPQILAQDETGAVAGLGGIIAGIAGKKSTAGITPMIQPELELWSERIMRWTAPSRWAGWDKIKPETRAAVATRAAEELLKSTPPELAAAIEEKVAAQLGIKGRRAA